MKNLKLFVAPLFGVTLLAGCGPKPINVDEFKTKVQEKFDLNAIRGDFTGKKQHATGTVKAAGGQVEQSPKITGVTQTFGGFYRFTLEGDTSQDYDILSVELIDYFGQMAGGITFNYFINGDTYTIEGKAEKTSLKYVWNKNLVITHSEEIVNNEVNKNLNFSYES